MNKDEKTLVQYIRTAASFLTALLFFGDGAVGLYRVYEALDHGKEEQLIPIVFVMLAAGAAIWLLYMLVCGFAQLVDDVHALRCEKEDRENVSPTKTEAQQTVRCASCGSITVVEDNGACEESGGKTVTVPQKAPQYTTQNPDGPAPFGMWRCARCGGFTVQKQKTCRCGYKRP